MSRKVNLSVLLSASLSAAMLTREQLEEQIEEGVRTNLPGVFSADVEDVSIEMVNISPDHSRVSLGLDILIRADYDADWVRIEHCLDKYTRLYLPRPARVLSQSVSIAVTDSR